MTTMSDAQRIAELEAKVAAWEERHAGCQAQVERDIAALTRERDEAVAALERHKTEPDQSDPDGWVRRSALNHWCERATKAEAEVAKLREMNDAQNRALVDLARERDEAREEQASLREKIAALEKGRDAALEKAAQYERDWYDAKSEFGTAMGKMRQKIAALEAALVASATCSACRGTGTIWPECKFCDDSTHDHECPPKVKCAKCEGTGKHALARDALSGGTAALDATKAQAKADGYRAGQERMRERAMLAAEDVDPFRTEVRDAIRALQIEEPKP